MSWWIWVLVGFFLFAIEFASTTLHVAFFGAGAFFVGILIAFGWNGPLWQQLVVFTVSSLVALFFVRPILVRKWRLSESKVVDTLVGESAIAMDDIGVHAIGKAEMRGSAWNAQNVGSTPLARGQRCKVASVEGLLLHVTPE